MKLEHDWEYATGMSARKALAVAVLVDHAVEYRRMFDNFYGPPGRYLDYLDALDAISELLR